MLDLLYDESSALFVLGSLCNDTSLLDEKHPLSKYDFRCKEFDKIIFVVIKTLKERGAKSLNEEDFVEFLKNYPAQYAIFEDNITTYYMYIDFEQFLVLDILVILNKYLL